MVAAMGQPHLASRQGRRTATCRAAGRKRGVPGVPRAPEHLVEGRAAGPKLRRVRLRNDNSTLPLDALHDGMRGRGDVIPEDRRAVGGAYASDVSQVFDGDGEAREPSRFALRLTALPAHEATRVLTTALEAKRW